MSLLAMLLLAVGVADIARPLQVGRLRPPAVGVAAALATLMLSAWGLGLSPAAWWMVVVLTLVAAAWMLVPNLPHPHARVAGLGFLAVSVVGVLAFGQHLDVRQGPLDRWYETLEIRALDDVDLEQFVLGVACLVFLHTTANVIVRLVLAGAGPQVLETENTLKGGRILGPLERWFIFALALVGQPGAIAAVVAAKGIVRFPEISRSDASGNKAEYVLVGSFVSWLLALAFVPLF